MKLFGQPLIVRSVTMAQQVYGIRKVMIPSEFSDAIQLVQQSFPSIDVEEFCEEDYNKSNVSIKGNENLEIPLNTLIHYSKRTNALSIETIMYPGTFWRPFKKFSTTRLQSK